MDIDNLKKSALAEIAGVNDSGSLETLRVKYLGRKSELVLFLRELKNKSPEERAELGQKANSAKQEIAEAIDRKGQELAKQELARKISQEKIDITAPGKKFERGHLHPLTLVRQEIESIFRSMGFSVIEGPELEEEWYNFDALNIPADHPARDMQDTFWLKQPENSKSKSKLLMRTHTSPVQVRFMEKHQPPFRIIVPGRAFRNEATDATHEVQLHQLEGLMVGKDVSMANLKGVLEYFLKLFFKDDLEVKFVSSYFQFTEPSVEVMMKGQHGRLKDKWLEIAGAGMVNQQVFKSAGYAHGEYQGFAFGFGIDRLAMIKYGIDDIRLLFSSDLRFLKQF